MLVDKKIKPTKQQLFNEEQKKLLKNRKVVQLNKFIKGDVSAFSVTPFGIHENGNCPYVTLNKIKKDLNGDRKIVKIGEVHSATSQAATMNINIKE